MVHAPRLRSLAFAALLLPAACGRAPKLAELPAATLPADAAPAIALEGAAVVAGKVVVTYRLDDRGTAITGANATTLAPTWILAWLSVEPVSGLPAWRSMLLTGTQTVASLPPAGPGTATSQLLANVKQPGYETSGTTAELGDGRFTYTFKDALPALHPLDQTLRVAVYLGGATGTVLTNATLDFRPDGDPSVAKYDTVTDANCNGCHGTLSAHGGRRIGVKLCVACHTWLCADPDTVDPAALNGSLPATKGSFPNPMEMGRLTHRIHRGKKLPTLYLASSALTWPPDYLSLNSASPWPGSRFTAVPPLPFLPSRNALAPVGTKFSAIGRYGAEYVFGRVASRIENFQPAMTLAEGVAYPQDLRNCDACHAGAPQAAATVSAISRRTCSGCHPDVFYGDPNNPALITPDSTHLAHTGGKQLDDTHCVDCHATAGSSPFAPIAEIHRPLTDRVASGSPHWSRVTVEILDVQNMKAGQSPVITFKVFDRAGEITPLNTTAKEATSPTSSPVPRGITPSFILAGPTTDYQKGSITISGSPAAATASVAGVYVFDFATSTPTVPPTPTTLPATASGTWAIGISGRRQTSGATIPALYTPPATDPNPGTFNWPYTGESLSEWMTNDVKFVELATGTFATDPRAARRQVVDQAKCDACHLELNLHGGNRHEVAVCLLCHTPDATDWSVRPRDTRTVADGGVVGTSMVLLNDPIDATATTKRWGYATVDGIEERSINFKTMLHRIHVGERVGAASLEGIRPYVVYGRSTPATAKPGPVFFDDIRFPNDLANCEVCHLPNTWTIESIPAGAQPTTANERGNILHTGTSTTPATATHTSTSEPKALPITGTCLTCHTSGAAAQHAAGEISGSVELCATCHGASGAQSIRRMHSVP
jgi:OmcA/MtrC family decaheme c-type cytochrome